MGPSHSPIWKRRPCHKNSKPFQPGAGAQADLEDSHRKWLVVGGDNQKKIPQRSKIQHPQWTYSRQALHSNAAPHQKRFGSLQRKCLQAPRQRKEHQGMVRQKETEDRYIWDTSGGFFSVKEGYKSLQNTTPVANWNLHSAAWKTECLPKVKHFNWTLLKGKILTAENLRKRGIQGPSIYCFCRAEEESIQHSFLLCPFAKRCWNQLTSPLETRGTHEQMHNLQKNWKKDFPYPRKGKNNLIRVWKCIPASLCWNLWLARNNHVFNNKMPKLDNVIAKTIANISEAVSANFIASPDQSSSVQEEMDWYSNFNITHSQSPPPPEQSTSEAFQLETQGIKSRDKSMDLQSKSPPALLRWCFKEKSRRSESRRHN